MVEVSRAPAGSRRNSATQANRSRGVGGTIGSIMTRPGRSASSAASNEYYVSAAMNLQSMDLEDLMVMEAVRLSLVEEEERRRREHHQQQLSEQNESESGNATTNGEQQAAINGRRIEEEDEDIEDDDDQPLYNTVVQNMLDRRANVESSSNSSTSNLSEVLDSPRPLNTEGEPSDEINISSDIPNAPAESTDLPAFVSSNDGSPQNRDRKRPIIVDGGDRSGLDGVSM
jgi:hypothetical protein